MSPCSSGKTVNAAAQNHSRWGPERESVRTRGSLETRRLTGGLQTPTQRLTTSGRGGPVGAERPRRKVFSPAEEEVEGPLPLPATPGTLGGREESRATQWVGMEVGGGGDRGCGGRQLREGGCETADVGRLHSHSRTGRRS